jgi:Zn-dependent protease
MHCEFCGKEESLPFVCNYCGGAFCAEHRLPEAHLCKGDLSQKRYIAAPPTTTFSWQGTTSYQPSPVRGKVFSGIEVRDILVAWLGLGLAFFLSIAGVLNVLEGTGRTSLCAVIGTKICLSQPQAFAISLATVGSGFVLHELSHKFTAQRYGYWAEFRMWPMGVILALLTSLFGFIFAAPGATYISGSNISESENGKISLAGPITNVLVASIFLPVWFFAQDFFFTFLGFEGVFINIFLALFNLLPIMPLDGAKVFRWGKIKWAAFFIPLAIVFFVFLRFQFG